MKSLEKSTREEYNLLDAVAVDTQAFMREKEEHLKEQVQLNLHLQQLREMGGTADIATYDQSRQIRLRRVREEVSHHFLTISAFILNAIRR